MNRRKICVVTGTRAEYGLLSALMNEIKTDYELQLQIVVTGMHLCSQFGYTYREIEQDGFQIDEKIEMLLASDTPTAVIKSVGLATIGFADVFERLKPDILVLLGDRTEALAAAQAALIARIPIAHIHGGELTEGAVDDAIRHSITKMAHLHFVAADSYSRRVIQLGENPSQVFNFGTLGIENIRKVQLRTREDLELSIGFSLGDKTFLVTYHPVTLYKENTEKAISALLDALDDFPEAQIIFTKPNSDAEGQIIVQYLDRYASLWPERVKVVASLGLRNYLSAVALSDVVIGNSSSGLLEVPVFKKATVNIGTRQTGRLKADSVIDCEETKESIAAAIQKALSHQFQQGLQTVVSPYGEGSPSIQIKEQLKTTKLDQILIKSFYDIVAREGGQ